MKKIMFSYKYGVESAVLTGIKTQTRRVITMTLDRDMGSAFVPVRPDDIFINDDGVAKFKLDGKTYTVPKENQPAYHVGEVVAIAQSYETLANSHHSIGLKMFDSPTTINKAFCGKGWKNKMFVKAEYMPHHIRIVGIRAEQLQDISNEDAKAEGVYRYKMPPLHHERDPYAPWAPYIKPYKHDHDNLKYFCEARYAFAYLIDKVSGTGTWKRNPWVYVYTFELVD